MVAAATRPGIAMVAIDVRVAAKATAEAIAERQAQRLGQLLQAALATRFYRRSWHGCDPSDTALSALPAVSKSQLMRNFDDAVTDPEITLAGLRAFTSDPQRIGERFLGHYAVWESSGSTGEPGWFVQDDTAMAIYDGLEATRRDSPRPWLRLWDPMYLAERIAFVGAIGGHFASHVSVQRLRAANPWLAMHWRSFSILEPTCSLVAQLNAFAPSIVATYPTAAALLADEACHGTLRIHPQEVWTGGETLSPAVRLHIEQAFGCALRNSYGTSEFLPIAWECSHGRLHVNADWVILEPVDADHRPVPLGQVSHTTLLTNLANHVQPLVRVDIGDRIALHADRCDCGSALPVVEVQGRRDDVLVVPGRDGRPVTLLPLALTTLLEDEAGVFDFQLQQLDAGDWRLTLGPGAPHSRMARERCRRVLADFAAAQGAADLHIVTRGRGGAAARAQRQAAADRGRAAARPRPSFARLTAIAGMLAECRPSAPVSPRSRTA